MVVVAASDTIRYQNNSQINITTNRTIYNKTQTITITTAITGTARFSYGFGANSGCYASPGGCIGTQIRKGGTILGEWWPPDGVGSNVVDLAINFVVNDVIELWVENGDGDFITYTNNFHISYDLAGSASFTSTPTGARIWIDGVDKGVNTPNTISGLSAGSHNYTLKLTGYQDTSGSFSVTAGSTTTVPLVTFPASAYFTSTPTGARIWIDGIDKGVNTPNTILGLSAGSHNYTLKLTGYLDTTGTFSATSGQTTTVPLVTLTPATGSASFTSSPSVARIWIDGIDKGVNTPNTISGLSAGNHSYTLKLVGYQDTSGSFSVIVGSTTTVPLVTFPASAYFTSTPTGATVWVDDTNLGTVTPATVVGLTAGTHAYRLINIGYTNRGSFSAVTGTTTNVSATLTAVGLNGSIWVEDQYLCYINTSNVVTYVIGTSSGAVAGLPGSIWIEGTQLVYIDSNGNKRLLPVTTLGTVTGLDGSLWIDGNYLYYIISGIQRYVTI